MNAFNLRLSIHFDARANGFAEAAAHQSSAEAFYESVRVLYPDAVLEVKQVRADRKISKPRGNRRPSGAVAFYED